MKLGNTQKLGALMFFIPLFLTFSLTVGGQVPGETFAGLLTSYVPLGMSALLGIGAAVKIKGAQK